MRWLITGGAGFIGCNTARRLIDDGHDVVIYDNLGRAGAELNLGWLRDRGRPFAFVHGDVRDAAALAAAFREHGPLDVLLHLAAQVAVTTSVANPREDFEINALGTFNVCDAVRTLSPETVLLYASTNKVYGGLHGLPLDVDAQNRYALATHPAGIPEDYPLDLHSPYGCSKGAGDQYAIDYARIYGLRSVAFRQSCIYGPRQFGLEDQGWVAWFTIAALLDRPITIYGDGRQVRDVLFVDDLIDCYLAAVDRIDEARGQAYNVGGGPDNTLSLLECLARLEDLLGKKPLRIFESWRPGDQRVFVCSLEKARKQLGWSPRTSVDEGLSQLVSWVVEHRSLLAERSR